jgi:hypothetical protein
MYIEGLSLWTFHPRIPDIVSDSGSVRLTSHVKVCTLKFGAKKMRGPSYVQYHLAREEVAC